MDWIISHPNAIVDVNKTYIVFAIGGGEHTYLYEPQVRSGWQFKNLTAGCYAAIPMPEWKGMI